MAIQLNKCSIISDREGKREMLLLEITLDRVAVRGFLYLINFTVVRVMEHH